MLRKVAMEIRRVECRGDVSEFQLVKRRLGEEREELTLV
jgi:hypothetical protein